MDVTSARRQCQIRKSTEVRFVSVKGENRSGPLQKWPRMKPGPGGPYLVQCLGRRGASVQKTEFINDLRKAP